MATIESKFEWVNNGVVFEVDGKNYIFDTGTCGVGQEIIAMNAKVGPFQASQDKAVKVLDVFRPAFQGVRNLNGVFAGTKTLSYFLTGDTIVITNDMSERSFAEKLAGRKEVYFLPFGKAKLASFCGIPIPDGAFPDVIVDATVNGHDTQLFFDSGARMTILHNDDFLKDLKQTGEVRDYVAMAGGYRNLPLFECDMKFPCGLARKCNVSFFCHRSIDAICMLTQGRVTGVLGIDLLDDFDLLICKDGLHLYEKLSK